MEAYGYGNLHVFMRLEVTCEVPEMPLLPISEGGSIFYKYFIHLTPKFGNLFLTSFCAFEVSYNFENLSSFCLNPSCLLDVNVGICEIG